MRTKVRTPEDVVRYRLIFQGFCDRCRRHRCDQHAGLASSLLSVQDIVISSTPRMVIEMHGLLLIAASPTFDTQDSRVWVAAGVAAMAAMYLFIRPKLRKKDPLEKRPFSNLHTQRTVEQQMSNLLVELSEMTRQLSAQLDTRATKLEVLMSEADEKIAQLKAGINAAGAGPSPADYIPPPPADRPRIEPDTRHSKVYALADEGRNANEIASALERPKGEVELILALRARG